MKHMKEMKHISEVMEEIESEMITMWGCDEALHVMKTDPEYIEVIITAIFYEREHFKALGMIVAEA